MATQITILGCGTSTGVPLICCSCSVCRSRDKRNHRLRCSAWFQVNGKNILIDTATDLRTQALRAKIPRIDAVLYTHPHADHLHGIDELRSFNFVQKGPIPIYGNSWTCDHLESQFEYIFKPTEKLEGGGIPLLFLNRLDTAASDINVTGVRVIPISLQHGSQESVGYRINSVAYVTDCSYIPNTSLDRLKGLSVLFLDCLRMKPHGTHLNLDQALEVVSQLRPKRTFLTHLGHDFDYAKWSMKLPKGVYLAYDGLKVTTR